MEVNSKAYWDHRFGSGDWREKGGFNQTRAFADAQVPLLGLAEDFSGTLCDFGCGAGDAMPVYRARFPHARLLGVDFSAEAIAVARSRYSAIASFEVADAERVPPSDVIIASNVLEHHVDPEATARSLLSRCARLYVVVPYRERIAPGGEHVGSFDRASFGSLGPIRRSVFAARIWSEYGRRRWIHVYLKNVVRLARGRPLVRRNLQIMFAFRGEHPETAGIQGGAR